jgi:hypothetical protein
MHKSIQLAGLKLEVWSLSHSGLHVLVDCNGVELLHCCHHDYVHLYSKKTVEENVENQVEGPSK